jgi:hypothetical protein
MALIPLNTFKTRTKVLVASTVSDTSTVVYTAPVGVTSIVLMAQVANVSTSTQVVNFAHHRRLPVFPDAQGNNAQAGENDPDYTDSFLVKNFAIPDSDAASLLTGKLVIESLDSIRAYSENTGTLQLVLSILETAND